jgi:electron transport complex protein RnfC
MAKGSSGLLFLNKKEASKDVEYNCLHCGRCVDVCPHNLIPSMISTGARNSDWDMAEKAGAMDCMKCGTCAYVCPAQIKMVQWIDIAKVNVGRIIRERQTKS